MGFFDLTQNGKKAKKKKPLTISKKYLQTWLTLIQILSIITPNVNGLYIYQLKDRDCQSEK